MNSAFLSPQTASHDQGLQRTHRPAASSSSILQESAQHEANAELQDVFIFHKYHFVGVDRRKPSWLPVPDSCTPSAPTPCLLVLTVNRPNGTDGCWVGIASQSSPADGRQREGRLQCIVISFFKVHSAS